MKKLFCIILTLLVFTGCTAAQTQPTTAPTEPAKTEVPTLPEVTLAPDSVIGGKLGEELPFENAGKARLKYTGNRSYVRYVTSVEELPPECSWEGYDEAYFKTKALLIVVETLNSGSVQLDLEAIRLEGDTASVHIKRTMEGDLGTSDMATWILWAEVERGLEYTWSLANATQLPEGEKY